MQWTQSLTILLAQNDLDLDFFCRAIIHADIERIKRISCPNVYLGAHHEGAHIRAAHDQAVDMQAHIDAVFGACTPASSREAEPRLTASARWREALVTKKTWFAA